MSQSLRTPKGLATDGWTVHDKETAFRKLCEPHKTLQNATSAKSGPVYLGKHHLKPQEVA